LRKGSSHKESSYSSFCPKKEYKKEREESFSKDKSKLETPKNLERGKDMQISHTRTRDIQCFKCLGRGHIASQCSNKRTVILRGKDEYNNQDDESREEEEKENNEGAYPCEGILTLNNQPNMKHET